MATKKKIFIRIALLAGGGYLFYKNKDKIFNKINKLSRMGSVDEMVIDVGATASNALEGAVSMAEEAFEYVTTIGDGNRASEPPNPEFNKEFNEVTKDMPSSKSIHLKRMAEQLVLDIRGWDSPEHSTSDMKIDGKIPVGNYLHFYNVLNLKNNGEFERVVKMVNIMLQYNHPYDIKFNTVKDLGLPSLEYYMNNPPDKYVRLNDIDHTIMGGRPNHKFNLKPRELFTELGNRIRSDVGNSSGRIRGETIINSRYLRG